MRMLDKYYTNMFDRQSLQNVADIPAIDVTEACRWYYETPQPHLNVIESFPVVVPPFSTSWVEFSAPRFAVERDGSVVGDIPFTQSGALMFSYGINEKYQQEALLDNYLFTVAAEDTPDPKVFARQNKELIQDKREKSIDLCNRGYLMRWIVSLHVFFELLSPKGNLSFKYLGSLYLAVDPMGKVLPDLYFRSFPKEFIHIYEEPGSQYDPGYVIYRPFLFAASLMHAKNVTLEDAPSELTRQQRRYRERRGIPEIKFKTLHIDPMRKQVRQQREDDPSSYEQTEAQVAMHLCRGHFKDYRDGKGLFGKHRDIYWWESQVRGSPDHGTVVKDYAVDAPKGESK